MHSPPLPPDDLRQVVAQTRGLWEETRGQRLLLTGGTGFFGRWQLESFLAARDELQLENRIAVVSRDPRRVLAGAPHLSHPAIDWIEGDVRSFAFPEGEFPYVIHGATTAASATPPLELMETIIGGTRRVLDFAASHGTRKFLFVSSGAVYGSQTAGLPALREETPTGPDPLSHLAPYAEGKRAAETLCAVFAKEHRCEVKIARCFAFVGPLLPLDAHFAIGNFLRDALKGGPIRVGGDGTPVRSYLYASDLAAWLHTILLKGASLRPYNVGSPHGVTVAELARAVRDAVAPEAAVEIAARPGADATTSRYLPDTTRAHAELGLGVTVPLDAALRKTAAWARALPLRPAP